MAFSPPTVTVQQGDVGSRYHLAIGTTTSGLSAPDRVYGYTLAEGTKFEESTDLHAKELLTQYSSPLITDRDFVNTPRVTDGNFSGGGLQTVFIDPTKYFDSDLDVRTPGYLILRPGYNRATRTPLGSPTLPGQAVAWNGDYWFTFGESNRNFYSANGGATHVAGSVPIALDTDGQYLYVGYATAGLDRYPASGTDTGTVAQVATALNGTARQWWVINLGTQGVFAYYVVGNNTLYKIDLTVAFPVAAASQAQVALGSNNFYVTDLCPYQSGIAILTNDVNGSGMDVWFHDGANLTRIIRVEGYRARGMCNCLGGLYVAAEPMNNHTPPILARISYGAFSIVAKAGSPFFSTTSQQTLQPRASSHFVYWPVINPSISGITGTAVGQVIEYNALTGALAALPVNDTQDFANQVGASVNNGLRAVAVLGESVAMCFWSSTVGTLQFQYSAFGTKTFRTTGWMVSSKLDFNTPSIPKMFRRMIVAHAPLAAGESILIQAWVSKDPLAFTTTATKGSGSTQYTEQATNSTLGSTQTVLALPAATIGNYLFLALKLTAGTSQATSPTVYYVSTEIGVPWTWRFTANCSSKRKDARGNKDLQGVRGIDLYGLLHDAWENAQAVTLYHPNGNSYTAVIEGINFVSSTPLYRDTSSQPKDYEATAQVLLRQSTV